MNYQHMTPYQRRREASRREQKYLGIFLFAAFLAAAVYQLHHLGELVDRFIV